MLKNFVPMNDKVLIKPLESGEKRRGAIIIADMRDDSTRFGRIIAVGPGRQTEFGSFITVNAKVGDVVVIPKIGAQRVEIENEEYWTVADRELVGTAEYVED